MKETIPVLLITNKTDITTDFIVRQLTTKKIRFYRLNTEEIGVTVSLCFDFRKKKYSLNDSVKNISIDLLHVKSVYFRRPEINSVFPDTTPAEANFLKGELMFTLEGLYKILQNAFWFNHVEAIRKAENKIFQLMLAAEIGFVLPESMITNQPESAFVFYETGNRNCIIKPIRSGLVEAETEEGVIFTSSVQLHSNNIERIVNCPVYLQHQIEKQFDIRITVVGNTVYAASIHSQGNEESIVDWRKSISPLDHSRIDLPDHIVSKCLALTKKLNLNFGAIDMILNKEGEYIFLEINPNGQWAWIENRLQYPISEAITNILIEKTA